MKKIAKTIRSHKKLLLNWFEAKNQSLLGAVEGQNNKEKVVIIKSYGVKTAEILFLTNQLTKQVLLSQKTKVDFLK